MVKKRRGRGRRQKGNKTFATFFFFFLPSLMSRYWNSSLVKTSRDDGLLAPLENYLSFQEKDFYPRYKPGGERGNIKYDSIIIQPDFSIGI